MLAPHAASVCHQVLPAGREEGGYYCVGSIEGEPGQSLKVQLKGTRQGKWQDYAGDDHGDLLELVSRAAYGGDKGEAIRWAKSFLGITDMTPAQFKQARRKAIETATRKQAQQQEDDAKMRRHSRGMWLAAQPGARTPAQAYLEARGIDFGLLGHFPGALRYDHVWNKVAKEKLPCMLAAIMNLAGQHIATHRTWIVRDGGTWRSMKKELGKGAKQTLGRYYDDRGFIPLWKGLTTRGRIPDGKFSVAIEGKAVQAAEGIENALSVIQTRRELPGAAAVMLAQLARLPFPHLIWIGDNDPDNPKAQALLEKGIAAQQQAGNRVQCLWPLPDYKDFNDQLLGKRIGA